MNWDDEMSPVFSTPPGSPSLEPSVLIWSQLVTPNAPSLATNTGHEENETDAITSGTQVDMFATQEASQAELNGSGEVRAEIEEVNDSPSSTFAPVDRKCRGAVHLTSSSPRAEPDISASALPLSASLFDCTFVTECVLKDCKDLVGMARMVYSDLAFGGRTPEGSAYVTQIDAFCQYMLLLARHLALTQRRSDLVKLCREMKHFLVDIGLIRQLATCAQLVKVSCLNPNSLLHGGLIVWTTAHTMFVLLHGVCSESANQIELMDAAFGHVGLVKQSTYLLADSLLAIAGVSPCSSLDEVLPCECVANSWSVLLTSTDGAAEGTLWTTMQSILAFNNSTADNNPSTSNACDSTLLYGFADNGSQTTTIRPLLFLDVVGHLCRLFAARHSLLLQRGASSLTALIGSLSRMSISGGDKSGLQRMMRTCADVFGRIQAAAGADVVVQVAWEEMCKRLGNGSGSFEADDKVLPQTGSSSEWIERIVRYADAHAATHATSVNIWQTFIELTVVVCRTDAVWQRVRPRIYSKLPVGKLRALSVVGLKNVVALWLTLAYVIDLREVTSKLISQVLPAVLSPSGDFDRLQVYFRTVTVLLRWHHHQSFDCAHLSNLLFNCIGIGYNDSLKLVNQTSGGRSVAILLSELVTDTVGALVGNDRRFPTSASRLLEVPMVPVVKCVPETTVERMLETLTAVADRVQPDDTALLSTMEERVWPMALERWKSRRTASAATARFLAAVTRALLLSRRRTAVEKLNAALCETLNDREDRRPPTAITVILLQAFFADHRVFIEMGAVKKAPRDVALVVACWLCIAFLDDGSTGSPNARAVSRAVARVLLQSALPAFHASADHTTVDVCHCLFAGLAELAVHKPQEAQELAQDWICPIIPVIESELKAVQPDSSRFRPTYRLLGDLLRTCAPVLYRTGIHVNKCPLVRIYNGLVEKQVLRTTANDIDESRPVYLALGGLVAGVGDLPLAQSAFLQRLACEVVYHTSHVPSLAVAYQTAMSSREDLAFVLLSKGVEYALMQTDGEKGRSFVTLCCRTLSRTANESVRRRLAMAMQTALGDGRKIGTWWRRPSSASADLVETIAALNTPPTTELAVLLGMLGTL